MLTSGFNGSGQSKAVWIAWERQRRSLTLSERIGARLVLCLYDDRRLARYPLSIWKTIRELSRSRGKTVFVQNPSQVLAALAVCLRRVFNYVVIVDRHSNFSELEESTHGFGRRVEDSLSNYSVRRADLTIVTNRQLEQLVAGKGGRPFVLPDPFPRIGTGRQLPFKRERGALELLFVASWSKDEPIAAMIEACRRLRGEVVVRITGRVKPDYERLLSNAPPNFIPIGFVSDEEYFDLMARCDAVAAISTRPATLTCGAYEALELGKPVLLGNSDSLREFFCRGAVYTDGTADDLERQIRILSANLPQYCEEVREVRERRGQEWEARLAKLMDALRHVSGIH